MDGFIEVKVNKKFLVITASIILGLVGVRYYGVRQYNKGMEDMYQYLKKLEDAPSDSSGSSISLRLTDDSNGSHGNNLVL